MNREKLIEIYQDTKLICQDITIPKTEKVTFSDDTKQAGIHTDFIEKSGNILVEPIDTVSAITKYSKKGKTAALNMASSRRKGGGVENGAMAQEECLFRCSNLFTIEDNLYPISSDQYIYTHNASFVKDKDYNRIDPILSDVITIPAINLNTNYRKVVHSYKEFGYSNDENGYESLTLDKMFYMINSAALNGCDNLILGAWGCGVFNNNPNTIAKLFKKTLEGGELYKLFDNIVFAIINDRNSVGNNYEVFLKTFR